MRDTGLLVSARMCATAAYDASTLYATVSAKVVSASSKNRISENHTPSTHWTGFHATHHHRRAAWPHKPSLSLFRGFVIPFFPPWPRGRESVQPGRERAAADFARIAPIIQNHFHCPGGRAPPQPRNQATRVATLRHARLRHGGKQEEMDRENARGRKCEGEGNANLR